MLFERENRQLLTNYSVEQAKQNKFDLIMLLVLRSEIGLWLMVMVRVRV